jgi:hypothetical protein
MILSAMILSSHGSIRSSLQTGRSWQQNGGSRMLRFKAILLPLFCCHK